MNLTEIQQTIQLQTVVEIIEMAVMVFILIFLVYLILRLSAIFRKQDNEQGINQKIIDKRIAVFDKVATKLYDILCFYLYMGNWVEISPVDVIKLKRELERDTNIYTPLFSDELIDKIQEFNQLCFITLSGWEHDVKIKSLYELREEHNLEWEDNWYRYFDTNNVVEATMMKEKYDDLMDSFKRYLALP